VASVAREHYGALACRAPPQPFFLDRLAGCVCGGWQVVTASVGDSRCVMYPNGRGETGWQQLTNDHTAERPLENMRVHLAGARVARHTAQVSIPLQWFAWCESDDLVVGDESSHAAVSPHPPNPSYMIVARTKGLTYAAKVWALSIVQGNFAVAPRQTLLVRFAPHKSLFLHRG
jgi:hypothetical protein